MKNNDKLNVWIGDIAALIKENIDPDSQYFIPFVQEPEMAFDLIDMIERLENDTMDDERSFYSACIFALDICVAQLQSAVDTQNKFANKTLEQLMGHLAKTLNNSKHNLSFWLPILNAFYEVHTELSPELKGAYYELAFQDEPEQFEEINHIDAIREMIAELDSLSTFDIAENFFAQSYAMPPDFFVDLIIDLYSIEEGQDIALLALLHPHEEVRSMIVMALDNLIEGVTLSPISLSRLHAIKEWYPSEYEEKFNLWLKKQRLKGAYYHHEKKSTLVTIKASEVDGSGAQGIFIHIKRDRKNQLCGLLFKQNVGIKDAWVTPYLTLKEVKKYYHEAFDENVTLRIVDTNYLQCMTEHFLALTIENGNTPDLHLLEIQELLGLHFSPKRLTAKELLEDLSVQITPFTPDTMRESLKRTKSWTHTKSFADSWYAENATIDKLVNQCCNFVDGVKNCVIDEAMENVFANEVELHRDDWLFRFLWITLWLKFSARIQEKTWQDSFYIAYAISKGVALQEIPLMTEIIRQTVFHSLETMNERRTYLQ